ncbi:hypothetical protein DSO57_1000439 [Entomophthora muscae]|uniref:Uncharacterized protein n=1 Tax=Entomophthora muscae TaxID=34485 RepID=A0ACC2UJ87_9FUNG|nr:hypothetical protein DSO57_1000439 [Entomophthora muscae]
MNIGKTGISGFDKASSCLLDSLSSRLESLELRTLTETFKQSLYFGGSPTFLSSSSQTPLSQDSTAKVLG